MHYLLPNSSVQHEVQRKTILVAGISPLYHCCVYDQVCNIYQVCTLLLASRYYHFTSIRLRGHCRDAQEGVTTGRGATMACWLKLLWSWLAYSWSFLAGGEENGGMSPTTLTWSSSIASLTREAHRPKTHRVSELVSKNLSGKPTLSWARSVSQQMPQVSISCIDLAENGP